jgi:hypothetical protein
LFARGGRFSIRSTRHPHVEIIMLNSVDRSVSSARSDPPLLYRILKLQKDVVKTALTRVVVRNQCRGDLENFGCRMALYSTTLRHWFQAGRGDEAHLVSAR